MRTKWKMKEYIGDFVFTWFPSMITVSLCAYVLFPWSDLSANGDLKSFISDPNSIIAIIVISYAVVIAKNNFDLNQKIVKRLDSMKATDADSLFIYREELDSFEHVFDIANVVKFSGGHLNSVIIGAEDELLNYLRTGREAKFILPNPMNKQVIENYAEKLMINTSVNNFTSLLLVSIDKLIQLKAENYKIDFRLYDMIPSFGLQIIEAKKDSKVNVELYTLQTELKNRLSFPVYMSDSGEMYQRFEAQFEALWEDSHNIDMEDNLKNGIYKLLQKTM